MMIISVTIHYLDNETTDDDSRFSKVSWKEKRKNVFVVRAVCSNDECKKIIMMMKIMKEQFTLKNNSDT